MDYGVGIFATDYSIRADELAREAEEREFESMWLPEHTHIPSSRKTLQSGGGVLPEHYWHTYDPFVALTAAAMVTTRLKLATGTCLMIQRDPIVTAKVVASLDQISNGRVIFGIGGGWNREEIEHHGTEFRSRWRLLRERMLAMQELWTKDEAEFHGEFVNFEPSWSWPKPVQKPYPPILMGGDGATTFDRVVEFCDGWMPNPRGYEQGTRLTERITELKERVEAAGRDPASINVTIFMIPPDRDLVGRLEEAGVDRVVFGFPSEPKEKILPLLEKCAAARR